VAWRRCSGRCRRSWRCRCPRRRSSSSALAPRSWLLAPGSSLPRRGTAAARSFPLLSRRKQRRWRGENPNGVGGLASVIRLPGAFEARPRAARVICPQCPWPSAWLGKWHPRWRSSHASGARGVGGNSVIALPWLSPTLARTHRPSACGPPGWRGRPVARPARCGSVDPAMG
jgi:hypothetical protein